MRAVSLLLISLFLGVVVPVRASTFPDGLSATVSDSLPVAADQPPEAPETVSLLLYNRVIRDNKGNVRFDQNIVPNIRLNRLLKLELGFRFGERPQHFESYYHYKVELQTRSFWNTVRFIGRMSTNVIEYPSPVYTKSNYLLIAEGKRRLVSGLMVLGGVGYLTSFQQNGHIEGTPVTTGDPDNHLVYKLTLRYGFSPRGFLEASYGTYDVFNPYRLNEPFVQLATEYGLSSRTTFNAYFRYQEDHAFTKPLNEFLGVGVRLHLFRERR